MKFSYEIPNSLPTSTRIVKDRKGVEFEFIQGDTSLISFI